MVGGAICETEIGDKANAEKKQNKDNKQAASRKQLMEEKKREKEVSLLLY